MTRLVWRSVGALTWLLALAACAPLEAPVVTAADLPAAPPAAATWLPDGWQRQTFALSFEQWPSGARVDSFGPAGAEAPLLIRASYPAAVASQWPGESWSEQARWLVAGAASAAAGPGADVGPLTAWQRADLDVGFRFEVAASLPTGYAGPLQGSVAGGLTRDGQGLLVAVLTPVGQPSKVIEQILAIVPHSEAEATQP